MHSSTHLARATRAFLLALALIAGTTSPAAAQPPGDDEIRLRLVGQPVWHNGGDDLDLVVRIENESVTPLDGFSLQVRLFSVLRTRSDLAENLEVDPTRLESGLIPSDDSSSVLPGGARVVRLDQSLDEFDALAGAEAGVYPLTVTLTDADGISELDSVSTFLLYFPGEVDTPLQVVPVWTIGTLPSRGPDGVFAPHPIDNKWELENAVSERGWIPEILAALATKAGRGVRLGIAPSPRTIEELADMADGYERAHADGTTRVRPTAAIPQATAGALDALGDLVRSGRAQPLLAPYSLPELPAIAGDLDRMQRQFAEGEEVLRAVLDVAPGRGWIFPPGGRLDPESLDDLHSLDAGASTFFSSGSLELLDPLEESCPQPFAGATYTCPVKVTSTLTGTSRGYAMDTVLQERAAAMASDTGRIALQRLFAEVAMIWAEQPAVEDRVIPLVMPSSWHPPPRVANLFVRSLGRAPWITTLTPREGLHRGIGAGDREVDDEATSSFLEVEPYRAVLAGAEDALENFARIDPPTDMLDRLQRDLLVAEARVWGGNDATLSRGLEFARSVRAEIDRQFGRIGMEGRSGITLTSRTGEIPLVLRNDTGYDVTLEIEVDWRDLALEIDRADLQRTFPPGSSPLPLEATANASGIFLVEVMIRAPNGAEIDTRQISITSTEYNEIALAITIGALAFLVMFYVFRGMRRRAASRAN